MTTRRRAVLRDDRGSALLDAMVGVIIIAVTVSALTFAATSTSSAVQSLNESTSRNLALRNIANQLAADPGAVPEVRTQIPVTVKGTATTATVWRAPLGSTATLHVAIPATFALSDIDCQASPTRCIETEITVDVTTPGIAPVYVSPAWADARIARDGATVTAGVLGTFTPQSTVAEVRYLVGIRSATGPGAITFSRNGAVIEQVLFDETTNTSMYGSAFIPVGGTGNVTVSLVGASATLDHFTVYEAPQ